MWVEHNWAEIKRIFWKSNSGCRTMYYQVVMNEKPIVLSTSKCKLRHLKAEVMF